MDVQLPDGRILRNVPEGTTRAQIEAKIGPISAAPGGPVAASQPQPAPTQPAAPKTQPASAGARFLRAMAEPFVGGAQVAMHGLGAIGVVPQSAIETQDQATRDFLGQSAAMAPEGFDLARIGGNIANPVNWIPAGRVAQLTAKAPFLARALAQAGVGAGIGAVQPTADFGAEKASQVAAGGAAGAAGQTAASFLGKVAQPATEQARALMAQGVKLTPGQTLGGTAKRIEDAATSLPIIGDAIRGARTRGLESFNVAAANRALEPIGQTVPAGVKVGRDLVGYVRKTLGGAYDRLLPQLQFRPDGQYAAELQQIIAGTQSPAFTKSAQFQGIINDRLFGKLASTGGTVDGRLFKTIEEGLGKDAKRFLGSPDPDQRALGEALESVLISTRQALMRSNPAHADALTSINLGWANFARIRRAAGALGAEEGVFTPAQLQNAVRAGDSSVAKGQFAQGNALMQDLSETGKAVLPSKLPDSGTPERLLLNALTAGGGLTMAPNALLGLLGGAAAYTQPGQYVLRAALARPQGATAVGNALSQYGALGAAPMALQLGQQGQ